VSPLPIDPSMLRGPLVAELEREGETVERFSFLHNARSFAAILVRGAPITAFVNRCPHWGVGLNESHDDIWDGDRLVCSVHGAEFDTQTGTCVAGPCEGSGLTQLTAVVDGESIRVFLSGLLSDLGPARS
jgi:nitrite reductase/ring-hydroxylating ferredoxin subunit